MLNLLLNNEMLRRSDFPASLITTKPKQEVFAMTNQFISKSKRICQVEGCNSPHHAKGYCCKHYQQIKKYGRIRRTRNDPNKIISLKNVCLIVLVGHNYSKFSVAIIDKEDLDKIKKYRWSVMKGNNTLYAQAKYKNGGRTTYLLMHRLIMDAKKGQEVDHRYRHGLDNRKENLRLCTRQQNRFNSKSQKGCTSLYKGVSWHEATKKWQVYLCVDYKNKNLGSFDSQEDAAIRYDEAAKKNHGKFARLNFP